MTTLTTNNFKFLLAKQLYNLLDLSANAYLPSDRQSYIFLGVGKQLPWNSGTEVPPAATNDVLTGISLFDNGVYAKRMSLENASFVVQRIDWTTGTVYTQYDDANCNFGANLYVKNYKDQVFFCLWNNNGAPSTVEPEIFISNTSLADPYLLMGDGYKWKYMYTITSVEKQKFMTIDWMPVHNDRFVTDAALPGSIDIVKITNSGNNYTNGSAQGIITVNGNGTSANLLAVVVGGKVTDIIISNRGTGYTNATLTFNDIGVGSAAAATAEISPQNGHGYDPQRELFSHTLMFYCDFTGDESSVADAPYYPAENDFRQIFLLLNPKEYGTENPATLQNYRLYTEMKLSPGVGDFNLDEVVFQGPTYGSATFTANVIDFDEISNTLYINNLRGTPNENETIQGVTSGAIRVLTSIISPTDGTGRITKLEPYTGQVLYVSNGMPVTRNANQTDRVRFTLSF